LNHYQVLLEGLPVQLLEIPKHTQTSGHLAIIRFENKSHNLQKNIFKYLRGKGIGVQVHYSPVHLQPYYRRIGFSVGDFPHAETYSTNVITLPLFPELADADLIRVAKGLKEAIDIYYAK